MTNFIDESVQNNDLIFVENNQATTTSLKIAAYFEKDHSKILKDVKRLLESGEVNEADFGLVDYKDAKGEKRPMYNIKKDGFTLLTMGFTGARALKFKVDYIKAFNKMEEELKNQPAKKLSTLDLLKEAVNEIEKLEAEKQQIIEETKPAVQFQLTVNNAINSITVADFAKIIGTGEIKCYEYLRRAGFLMNYPKNRPYQEFINRGYFKVIEKTRKDHNTGESVTYFQTLITGKGQTYLSKQYLGEGVINLTINN